MIRAASTLSGTSLRLVLLAILAGLAVRMVVGQPYRVDSASMAPTLLPGDHVLGQPLAPASLPGMATAAFAGSRQALSIRRGDIILFAGADGRHYVKRVIGIGGDDVALLRGEVRLNGRALPCRPEGPGLCREQMPDGRSHIVADRAGGPFADHPGTRIPPGHYFVLGDNRGDSIDSRLPRAAGGPGLVAASQLTGRAERLFLGWRGGRPVVGTRLD